MIACVLFKNEKALRLFLAEVLAISEMIRINLKEKL